MPTDKTAEPTIAERPKGEAALPALPAVLWLSTAWVEGDDGAACEAIRLDRSGRGDKRQCGTVEELVQSLAVQPVTWTVIFPAHCVSVTAIQAPPSNLDLFLQSLPYALEEELASDVETLHVATSPLDAGGWIEVAIVARDLVNRALRRLNALSLSPVALFSELQLVPSLEQQDTIVLTDTGLLWRRSTDRIAIDSEGIDSAIPLFSRSGEAVSLIAARGNAVVQDITDRLVANGVETVNPTLVDDIRYWQRQQIAAGEPVNLLQGEFAPVDPAERRKYALRWGIAAVVTAIVLQCGYWLGAGLYLHREASAAQAEAETLYRTLFPTEKRVINVRAQLQAHLDAQAANRGRLAFAQFMNHFGAAWQSVGMGGSLVKNISFDGEKRIAVVQVLSASVSMTEPLLKAIAANGIRAKIVSVSKQDDKDLVRLQLEWP